MIKYNISISQASYIQKNFIGWSFDKPNDYIPDKKIFSQLNHSAELHYLANLYNWDDGSIVLEWLLDSPLCTRSTANLLFWRAAPDWYLRFSIHDLEACPKFNRDGFIILRKIINKYERNDFSKYQIEFDPTDEIEEIMNTEPKWIYPSGVYDKIEGDIVLCEK